MNQGSIFLGGTFSNRHNGRPPVQFRRKSQPQLLKRSFIPQDQTHPFLYQ